MSDLQFTPDLIQCQVTHVDVSGQQVMVWAQTDTQSALRLEQLMDAHFKAMFDKYFTGGGDSVTQTDPQEGKYYVYCDKSNRNFYRVLVKTVDTTAANQSLIVFVDFGYAEVVANDRLMVYEPLFVDCRPLAEPFILGGVCPPKNQPKGWDQMKVKQCLKRYLNAVLWFAIYGSSPALDVAFGHLSRKVAKVYDNNRQEVLAKTLYNEYYNAAIDSGANNCGATNDSTPDLVAIDYMDGRPTPPSVASQPLVEIPRDLGIDSRLESALNLTESFNTSTLSLISDFSHKTTTVTDGTVEETVDLLKGRPNGRRADSESMSDTQSCSDQSFRSQPLKVSAEKMVNLVDNLAKSCDNLDAEINRSAEELDAKIRSITGEDKACDKQSVVGESLIAKSVKWNLAEDNATNDTNSVTTNSMNCEPGSDADIDEPSDDQSVKSVPKMTTKITPIRMPDPDSLLTSELEDLMADQLHDLSKSNAVVKISNAEDSSSVWCQLQSSAETLDALVSDMTAVYTNIEGCEVNDDYVAEVVANNALLAVYNGLECQWMRASVYGQPNKDQLNVFYVDFGSKETVELESCCQLLDTYAHLKPLAIHCRPVNTNVKYYVLKRLESREEPVDVTFGRVLDNKVIEVLFSDDYFQ